jgi:alanyl-tRNA synthetase
VAVIAAAVAATSALDLRAAADAVLARSRPAGVFLAAAHEGKVLLVAALTSELCARGLHAGEVMEAAAPSVGGKGGGRPELAFGGGPRVEALPQAIEAARRFLAERLAAAPNP